ncbi:MAG: HDOD domain-containing protein [Gammaproteobacteria bacterium]|nr:HDOD domain-containing protein [Gammaproteobacteria bacterium]MBU1777055.1 HDOD domain-containing protein [Gammaproteobacteria bacterium]MBU1969666.1 HDOD domain-containing protein [Gammaproteobacteria bacterium]
MEVKTIDFTKIPVQANIISDIIHLDIESSSYLRRLDDLISSDQGVASLVLRVVNSPLYSRGNKVGTIPLSISLLGYRVVRSLALLAFGRSLFSQTRDALFRLHVWQHSLLTALASQHICESTGEARLSDEAFIAGLMHDMGKVLMFTQHPGLYAQVFEQFLNGDDTNLAAEQRCFGFDHCQVGREAVRAWHLPESFLTYMGSDLNDSGADTSQNPVLPGLRGANYLVESAGIGGNAVDDTQIRRQKLLAFGLPEALCDTLLQDSFIDNLKRNDIYKLCASL